MEDNGADKKTLQDGMMHLKNKRKTYTTRVVVFALAATTAMLTAGVGMAAELLMDDGMAVGMPFGASEDANVELCPMGARAVNTFIAAWQTEDYETMYAMLDEESRKDYSFEDAKFDFQFLEFKEYAISSVRKRGDNFEFILSHGDWKDGDKDIRKMIISGKTFRIMMTSRGSPFKNSAESYF